jgi:hypothetical protein
VLMIEGPRLETLARSTLEASIDIIRRTAEDALNALRGNPVGTPRRDYELSFPPAVESVSVSGPRRKVPAPRSSARPNPSPEVRPEPSADVEPRPVFKRRRGR